METHTLISPTLELFELEARQITAPLSHILEHQVDYADIYLQSRHQESWQLDNGIVRPVGFSISQGAGVRAISGEKTAFSYTNDLRPAALLQAAQTARQITRQGYSGNVALPDVITTGSTIRYPSDSPLYSISEQQKHALLMKIDRIARICDPRVIKVNAWLTGSYDVIFIGRHDGLLTADRRPLVNLTISVVVQQGGRKEKGYSGGGRRHDYGFFDDETLQKWASEAVGQALHNLDAVNVPAGTYSVVLGKGTPGILLHEAIGHGLEGDFNRKGSSAFSGMLGERVAARGISVVDNGTLVERPGSLNFDDEGTPTQCTTLIEDGILCGYLHDSLNARLMNTFSTGNARRESYSSLPLPRMTNTYMLSGDYDPEEVISSVEHGLYAVEFNGGQVDISSGKYVFSATEAWWIEKGKLSHPVRGTTLIGDGPQALLHVSMVGNDLSLDSGNALCGKEGQTVNVGVGQPTLRIDNMTVGGTS